MTITLNGTTGITTPAVTNNGAYTGDGVSFADGTPSNTLVTTTGGNVGIGTASPQVQLQVNASGTNSLLKLSGSSSGSGLNDGLDVGINTLDAIVWNREAGSIQFATSNSERMRIDSSGVLLVNRTSYQSGVSSSCKLQVLGASSEWTSAFENPSGSPAGLNIKYSGATPNNTGNEVIAFSDSSASRFIVRSNGGIANYSANNVNLSDIRTKTDIELAGNYLDKICSIPVKTFKYKDQTDDLINLGVIAQDVEQVAPELVDVSGFGETPEDGVPLKAIYQTDLQYALMKAIQELKAELDTVKTELATLKGTV